MDATTTMKFKVPNKKDFDGYKLRIHGLYIELDEIEESLTQMLGCDYVSIMWNPFAIPEITIEAHWKLTLAKVKK